MSAARPLMATHTHTHTHTALLNVNKLAVDAKKSLYRWWISPHCPLVPDRTKRVGGLHTEKDLSVVFVFINELRFGLLLW